jgi:hypothetical protein
VCARSLPQKPRSAAEEKQFSDALDCMGDLYASATGTTVMRHCAIPERPASVDGHVALVVEAPMTCMHPSHEHMLTQARASDRECDLCGCDHCTPMYACYQCDVDICFNCCKEWLLESIREHEPAIRHAFGGGDTSLVGIKLHDGRTWRLRFATHAAAETASARMATDEAMRAAGLPNAYCFVYFNARAYVERGWTSFESGVSTEALSRLSGYPRLKSLLSGLPPKLIEIDGAAPVPAEPSVSDGVLAHSASVRAQLRETTFTGKGDKQRVEKLYQDYVVDIANALIDSSEEPVESYEGGLDEQGRPHGWGTETKGDGSSYEGEWRHGEYDGEGTYRFGTGDVYVGQFRRKKCEGCGCYTTADGIVYVGQWKNDEEEGHGTRDWPKGATEWRFYDGEWRGGEQHGHGVLCYSNGNIFEGQFKRDEEEGRGVMWYADGDVYDGEWKGGVFHGVGALHIASEAVRRRPWKGEYSGIEVARFKDGCPSGVGLRCHLDGTAVKLHFNATRREKKAVAELSHEEATKVVRKLGLKELPRSKPPLSDTASARVAKADERERTAANDPTARMLV